MRKNMRQCFYTGADGLLENNDHGVGPIGSCFSETFGTTQVCLPQEYSPSLDNFKQKCICKFIMFYVCFEIKAESV